MGIARNIARLIPNGSGLLPNANIEAVAASKLTGTVPDANAPSGSVIQTVQGVLTAQTESSAAAGTDVDINLYVSITPISSSNKVMVTLGSLSMVTRSESTVCHLWLERSIGGGAYSKITGIANYVGQGGIMEVYPTINYLDSPNTTSSVSYRVIGNKNGGDAGVAYHHNNGNAVPLRATLTALEIAA
jgi:hypothetical protein